jgi:Ca2+-transporting ATPase
MLQVWNLFNAKVYRSKHSVLSSFFSKTDVSISFYLILAVILIGQVLIVNSLGNFFDVAPLTGGDWLRIVLVTSPVLLVPEILRWIRRALGKS